MAAVFHPSSMPRVVPCPGSYQIGKRYKNHSGFEATEGTVAHEVAHGIMSRLKPESYVGKSIKNVLVTQEMAAHAKMYVDHCFSLRGPKGLGHSEWKHSADGLTGTVDFWTIGPDEWLYIRDFKYGFGWVEAPENWQLIAYATLLIDYHNSKGGSFPGVDLGIVQPRANHPDGPIRNWRVSIKELDEYLKTMADAMDNAVSDSPLTFTGPHCRYCPGLLQCHSARAAAGFAIDYSGISGDDEIAPEILAAELEAVELALKTLKYRQAALETAGVEMARSGNIIPGWSCQQSVGNMVWKSAPEQTITLGDIMGVDLRAPQTAITPAQARDRKIMDIDTIKTLTERKPGAFKLKRINERKIKELLK